MEDQRRPSRAAGYPASADTEPARTERNPVSADGGDRRALAAADEKFGRSTGHSAPADMEGRRSFTAVERDRFGYSLGRKQGGSAGYLAPADMEGRRAFAAVERD
ncbi:hypothetical protein HRG_013433 [Hirsutella rhossiliensis]